MTCTVELGSAVMESELSLLMVDAQLFRDETPLNLTSQSVTGTTHIYRVVVSSFSESNVGNYSCNATIGPQPSTFLIGTGQLVSSPFEIIIGKLPCICIYACLNLNLELYRIPFLLGIPPTQPPAPSGNTSNSSVIYLHAHTAGCNTNVCMHT